MGPGNGETIAEGSAAAQRDVREEATGSIFRSRMPACAQSLSQLCSCGAMAKEAERSDIVEIALAATFGDGNDVVGLPKAAATGDALHSVEPHTGVASGAASTLERSIGSQRVDLADGAATAIAREDLVAEIAGIGAETPLMHAVVAAEGAAAFGENLKLTPSAER